MLPWLDVSTLLPSMLNTPVPLAAVTQHEIAVEVELRTVVQVDGFPIDVTGGAGGGGVVEGQ